MPTIEPADNIAPVDAEPAPPAPTDALTAINSINPRIVELETEAAKIEAEVNEAQLKLIELTRRQADVAQELYKSRTRQYTALAPMYNDLLNTHQQVLATIAKASDKSAADKPVAKEN
jgi:predicted  nucleic acid-binding Zn-ribbon protein